MNVNDEGIMMGIIGLAVVMILAMAVSLKGDETIQCYEHDCYHCMVDLTVVDINGTKYLENKEHGIIIPLVED